MMKRNSLKSAGIISLLLAVMLCHISGIALGALPLKPAQPLQQVYKIEPLAELKLMNTPLLLEVKIPKSATSGLSKQAEKISTTVSEKYLLPAIFGGSQNIKTGLLKVQSISAETTVLDGSEKSGKAKTLILLLMKETYTAEPAMAEYSFEQDKIKDVKVTYPYTPPEQSGLRIIGKSPMTPLKKPIDIKTQANIPDNPKDFDITALVTKTANLSIKRVDIQRLTIAPPTAQALVNTAASDIDSAVTATDYVEYVMSLAGLSTDKLIGAKSTVANVNRYLFQDSNLLAWNNIGHGVTSHSNGVPCYGLVQWGGTQWASEFYDSDESAGLSGAVVLTNSCNSFMDPIKSSIKYHSTRTYIGGRVLLPINKSEWVDYYFWYYVLLNRTPMGSSLNTASRDWGLIGAFGLDGDSGAF